MMSKKKRFAALLAGLLLSLSACRPSPPPQVLPEPVAPTPPAPQPVVIHPPVVATQPAPTTQPAKPVVRTTPPPTTQASLPKPPTSRRAPSPATQTSAESPFPASSDPRETVPFLASDALAGRLVGSPGLQRAGDFLAAEFSRIGLSPLPGHGYFQPFQMTLSSAMDPSTNLTVNDKPLAVGTDFNPISLSAQGSFHGSLIFAGYSITRPEGDYDDFAEIDARGKVVLAFMKEPLNAKGVSRFAGPNQTWSTAAYFSGKAKAAADHGAVALLLVSPPSSGGMDTVNPFFAESGTASLSIPTYQISRRMADVLLANAEVRDLKSLQDGINGAAKPLSTELINLDVSGTVAVKHKTADVRNVMACLPGTGPHADECIVVGAHYDHLGKGQLGHMISGKPGSIFHGADDDASGTAAVLELAEQLKQTGPLSRSVLFVLFTGEEEGLIGSDYFVKNSPIPIEKIAAMLNMDMVGRLKDGDLLLGGASTAMIFDSMVNNAVAGTGLKPQTFERGGYGPSDHMSFALRKVPVLFLFTGLHLDYHRPTDTADKINYAGIDTIVDVANRLVNAMAVMPRQDYNGSNDSNSTMAFATAHSGAHRAALGVVPDYSSTDSRVGVPISGVGQGTPAEKAGFKGGDLLVSYNSTTLNNLQDLSDVLADASPGDNVIIKVMRDGKPVVLHAVLGERKP